MDYEAARANLRAYTPPRLDYGDSTHTTSIPDPPGMLSDGNLASGAVRTGEVSRESSNWNLDHGYHQPMTDPLGPDLYPRLASSEMAHYFLPSPGLQQKTDYPSAIEDLENHIKEQYEDAPSSLRGGTPASGPVRMGGMPHEPSNSRSVLPSNLPSLPPFTIPPGPSKLKENGEIMSVENPQTGLLNESDFHFHSYQPFPTNTATSTFVSKEEENWLLSPL